MCDTNLAQAISATNDSGSAYDTNVKYLLADKQMLSFGYTEDEIEKVENTLYERT